MMRSRYRTIFALVVCATLALASCRQERPRSRDELFREQVALPQLFIAPISNKHIVAPGDSGIFIDKESGEIMWPAKVCRNPNCPGRGSGGEPFLFVSPDPGYYIRDGKIEYDAKKASQRRETLGECPQCLKIRNFQSESDAEKKKYAAWVERYEMPEVAQQREKLEQQRREREEQLRKRMERKVDS